MKLLALIAMIIIASIPPLTVDQRARVDAARDGSDQYEDAFDALIENARLWTGVPIDEPVILEPDIAKMISRPADFRGQLSRIAGVLRQHTQLTGAYADVQEWFVGGPGSTAMAPSSSAFTTVGESWCGACWIRSSVGESI